MAQLNDDQTRELNRDSKLIQFLDIAGNSTLWNAYTPFKNKVIALKAHKQQLLDLAPTKEQTGTGITLSKSELKTQFALQAGDIMEKTKEYAIEINDLDLLAQVNHSPSEIHNFKDEEILPFATNFSTNIFTATLMANVTFITYEVTATAISDAVTTATSFNSKIGEAQSVEVTSDTANSDINDIITLIRKDIASLTRLSSHWRTSNPTFFKGFATASKRDDIGIRHIGADFKVTQRGVGVQGATVQIGDKTVTSDLVGNTQPIYVTAGDKEIICKLAGQPDKTLIHHFIRGHVDNITFEF